MPHLIAQPAPENRTKHSKFIFLNNSPFSWWLSGGEVKLPPEVERDNVEYKWKLTGMSDERRVHLVTQMRWRVGELGHCWYILGVKDNGVMEGVSEAEMNSTLDVIKDLVNRANLFISHIQIIPLSHTQEDTKFICQVKIELEQFEELKLTLERRVVFLGASGCGKTTLLSVLSDWGSLDDGRGKMRTRLLHHRHELLSGSTSSVTHQPLIFLPGNSLPLILTEDSNLLHLERRKEILGEGQVIQLVDSAGKLRFNHTVYSVLTSSTHKPDYAFVVIEAPVTCDNFILPPQTEESLNILQILNIPVAILISKIDQSSTEAISIVLEKVSKIVGQANLKIYDDEANEMDVDTVVPTLPVLLASSVTGDFLPTLSHFLSTQIPKSPTFSHHQFIHAKESASSALIIEKAANLVNVGPVVYGQVAFGSISVGDLMVLGPQVTGVAVHVQVKSIQRLKCPVNSALTSQHVSIALQFVSSPAPISKGMALIHFKNINNNINSSIGNSIGNNTTSLTLKPLRRIIAEMENISSSNPQTQYTGIIFVMGQRFPAVLNVQPRVMRRSGSIRPGSPNPVTPVCLVSFSEKRPATVFLFPGASIIFIGNDGKEKFAGRVIDYFA